jgi:hypothetical protein
VTRLPPARRQWYPSDRAQPVRHPPAPTQRSAAHGDPSRWLLRLLVVFGVVVAVFGTVRLSSEPELPQRGAVPGTGPGSRLSSSATGSGQVPLRLLLADQRIDAPVVPVDVLPGGALDVPEDPSVLGWWRDGGRPGAGRGTVVIDGHVDTRTQGPGVLYRLREMPLGVLVELSSGSDVRRYIVRAVHSYPKASLPPEVFDRTGEPRLVLISCGGEFDAATHQYSDNIVVYATPTE